MEKGLGMQPLWSIKTTNYCLFPYKDISIARIKTDIGSRVYTSVLILFLMGCGRTMIPAKMHNMTESITLTLTCLKHHFTHYIIPTMSLWGGPYHLTPLPDIQPDLVITWRHRAQENEINQLRERHGVHRFINTQSHKVSATPFTLVEPDMSPGIVDDKWRF